MRVCPELRARSLVLRSRRSPRRRRWKLRRLLPASLALSGVLLHSLLLCVFFVSELSSEVWDEFNVS